MIAIIEAYRAGLLGSKYWASNIVAGSIVAIVALPLAMAFAIASGVKPEQGLYTAVIAALLVGIFGGTRVQIAGPTGAFVVILASIVAKYGIDGLQIATFIAGIILIFMGLFKLGNIIKFIPDPVIAGFTTGIGFIIFIGEWKDFFGLPLQIPLEAHFYQKIFYILKTMPNLDYATTSLACLSLILILFTPKIVKKIPGSLVAMFFVTILQATFQFENVATIGSTFGSIPQYFPQFHFPTASLNNVLDLIEPAFTIALLGAIESLLSATAADALTGTKQNANQELMGQGIANIFTPLFGGFAATGAIARTATNIRSGGNSPIAAITHSILLFLIIVLLAPLAAYIPLCTLAAILFVVSYNMSDIHYFMHVLRRAPRYDVIVLLTTFFLTIFVNLVIAVYVGVMFAMFFFIRRMSQSISINRSSNYELPDKVTNNELKNIPENTLIYDIKGPFFFGATDKIEHTLSIPKINLKNIIFRLKDVPFIDITGLSTLQQIINQYQKNDIEVYFCEANDIVSQKLNKTGTLPKNTQIFSTLSAVISQINRENIEYQ